MYVIVIIIDESGKEDGWGFRMRGMGSQVDKKHGEGNTNSKIPHH